MHFLGAHGMSGDTMPLAYNIALHSWDQTIPQDIGQTLTVEAEKEYLHQEQPQ